MKELSDNTLIQGSALWSLYMSTGDIMQSFMLGRVIFASRCSFVRQPHPRPLHRSIGMLVLLKGMLTVLTFTHTVAASVRLALLALSELHTRSLLLSNPP